MTSSLTPSATDAFVCPLLKTGRDGYTARFDRALYQLVIMHEGGEETLDLGFSGSRVLERLLRIPGEVVSRDELMAQGWEGRVVGQGSLNQRSTRCARHCSTAAARSSRRCRGVGTCSIRSM